jgi:hypothetical protein
MKRSKEMSMSNVMVIQNCQMSQGTIKISERKENTHVEIDGVSATNKSEHEQHGPNEDYALCRTNTREIVAWLQN